MNVKPILSGLSLDKIKASSIAKKAIAASGLLTGSLILKNRINKSH